MKYYVYDYGAKADFRYTLVIPACKEDRALGVSAYLVFFKVWQDPYDGERYYFYEYGERKIGEAWYYGKSVTKHLDDNVRKVAERIVKEDFC